MVTSASLHILLIDELGEPSCAGVKGGGLLYDGSSSIASVPLS